LAPARRVLIGWLTSNVRPRTTGTRARYRRGVWVRSPASEGGLGAGDDRRRDSGCPYDDHMLVTVPGLASRPGGVRKRRAPTSPDAWRSVVPQLAKGAPDGLLVLILGRFGAKKASVSTAAGLACLLWGGGVSCGLRRRDPGNTRRGIRVTSFGGAYTEDRLAGTDVVVESGHSRASRLA